MQEDHLYYMHQCLELAKTALAAGDPPVGTIVVFESKVIGTGIESGRSSGDVTNHAEILAVRDAIKNGYAAALHKSSLYTTHEPCWMCAYAIRHYQIPEIVYGTAVPFIGGATSKFNILSTRDVPKWNDNPKIISGICLDECNQLNKAFQKLLNKL